MSKGPRPFVPGTPGISLRDSDRKQQGTSRTGTRLCPCCFSPHSLCCFFSSACVLGFVLGRFKAGRRASVGLEGGREGVFPPVLLARGIGQASSLPGLSFSTRGESYN